MPSVQRGSTVKRGTRWAARWYDENGERQFRGGFVTKSEAREWVDNKVDEVAALRRGDRPRVVEARTVAELVTRFLELHEVDAATTRKLRAQLKHATAAFGERRGLKLGKTQAPIRVAVTGRTVGPPLFESLEALGRERTLARVGAALERVR